MATREWVHVNEVKRLIDDTTNLPDGVLRHRLLQLISEQVACTEDPLACPEHGIDRRNCCDTPY